MGALAVYFFVYIASNPLHGNYILVKGTVSHFYPLRVLFLLLRNPQSWYQEECMATVVFSSLYDAQ